MDSKKIEEELNKYENQVKENNIYFLENIKKYKILESEILYHYKNNVDKVSEVLQYKIILSDFYNSIKTLNITLEAYVNLESPKLNLIELFKTSLKDFFIRIFSILEAYIRIYHSIRNPDVTFIGFAILIEYLSEENLINTQEKNSLEGINIIRNCMLHNNFKTMTLPSIELNKVEPGIFYFGDNQMNKLIINTQRNQPITIDLETYYEMNNFIVLLSRSIFKGI